MKSVIVEGATALHYKERTIEDFDIGNRAWVSLDGRIAHPVRVCAKERKALSSKEKIDQSIYFLSTLIYNTSVSCHLIISASGLRMRRLRERRQRGFRCITVEYCDADLDRLIRCGFLDRLNRRDPAAVERAIGVVLDRI